MNIAREERKKQWEFLKRTTTGRERIIEEYTRLRNPHVGNVFCVPYNVMIEALLDEQFAQQRELQHQ